MQSIEITADDVEPPHEVPGLRRSIELTMRERNIPAFEIGVVFCSARRMTELNQTYRGIPEPTDVLTFSQNEGEAIPTDGGDLLQGDIVVCLEVIRGNARLFGIDENEETCRVIVHGALHLCGLEHRGIKLGDPESLAEPMLTMQEDIVSRLKKELET